VPGGGRRGTMTQPECATCKKTGDQTTLRKCPICFKHFCEEHAYHMSGRAFCSQPCAEFFFFEPEE
jgi:hypothetical protein